MALLKLALMPDSQQSDESFRRVANVPARGLGAKAMEKIEAEAAAKGVSLLTACTEAGLGKKAKEALPAFAEAIRTAGDGERRLSEICFDAVARPGYQGMWRSYEERRGGEEDVSQCRCPWAPYSQTKQK